jgi:effector-binding domain-containing protein
LNWFETIDYIFKGFVLAGGAYLFYFMRNRYEARIEILKETQVEKYVERIKKFKELYENMIEQRENELLLLKQEMDDLSKQHLSKDEIIESQKKLIDKFKDKIYEIFEESWEIFLKDRSEYIEVIHYGDITNNFEDSRLWTIRFKDPKMMERFKHPILTIRKDDDKK